MELEDALTDVDQEIHSIHKKIEDLTTRLNALGEERRGLQLALDRHNNGASVLMPEPTDQEWKALNRTDAVERVLREAERALSPSQITDQLKEKGRDDSDPYVSAALSYLAREKRVHRTGRAQWRAGPSGSGAVAAGLLLGVAAAVAQQKGGSSSQ